MHTIRSEPPDLSMIEHHGLENLGNKINSIATA